MSAISTLDGYSHLSGAYEKRENLSVESFVKRDAVEIRSVDTDFAGRLHELSGIYRYRTHAAEAGPQHWLWNLMSVALPATGSSYPQAVWITAAKPGAVPFQLAQSMLCSRIRQRRREVHPKAIRRHESRGALPVLS